MDKTMKNDKLSRDTYSLYDFYLAAYLICSGLDLVKTDRIESNRVVFVLQDSSNRNQLIQDFYSHRARIDPLAYKDTISNLKALIHGMQR